MQGATEIVRDISRAVQEAGNEVGINLDWAAMEMFGGELELVNGVLERVMPGVLEAIHEDTTKNMALAIYQAIDDVIDRFSAVGAFLTVPHCAQSVDLWVDFCKNCCVVFGWIEIQMKNCGF